jgi:hypothetical protein
MIVIEVPVPESAMDQFDFMDLGCGYNSTVELINSLTGFAPAEQDRK